MNQLSQSVGRLVNAPAFEYSIIALILINAALLGMGTSPRLTAEYGNLINLGYQIVLGVFIVEALLKMIALAPRSDRYFREGWNVFDFLIIVFSLIPATGQFATIARLARLLRVLRLISTIKQLRLIVEALMRSIPAVGHVMILMSVVLYIYAIIGYQLFNQHDPEHWGDLGISALTLFRVLTLESWTEIMYTAMLLHPLAWLYFLSFVVVGTFVVINLFIAIIINNLDETKLERMREQPISQAELLNELRTTQGMLRRLESRMNATAQYAPEEQPDAAERDADAPDALEDRLDGGAPDALEDRTDAVDRDAPKER